MIRNIQLNHGGKYVCVINTDVESLSASAILVVKGKRTNCQGCKICLYGIHVHSGSEIHMCTETYFSEVIYI